MKFVIFGIGVESKRILAKYNVESDIVAFADNDKKKWGSLYNNIKIINPSNISDLQYDRVIIATEKYEREIYEQCIYKLGINKRKIMNIDSFICYCEENTQRNRVIGFCNVCQSDIYYWLDTGEDNDTVYNIIGNGLRKSRCPHCKSVDRFRWIYYLLQKYTDILNIGSEHRILHFAPEKGLSDKIKSEYYYTCDYVQGRGKYVVDMTDIQFKDSYFDYVIANHVLEHIQDEKRAIEELVRVTKDDGMIILSFPICMESDTIEKREYCTEELRVKYYGQRDHVRLYGKDYKERLQKYGLEVTEYIPQKIVDKNIVSKYKFIENDIVLFCRKKFE